MKIFQRKKSSTNESNSEVDPLNSADKNKVSAALSPINSKTHSSLLGSKTQEVPVLTEVVEVMSSGVTVEAVSKLIAECERYKELLAQWEQCQFPEIVARCQAAMQTDLEKSTSHLISNLSEKMSRTLSAELKVAMMQVLNDN